MNTFAFHTIKGHTHYYSVEDHEIEAGDTWVRVYKKHDQQPEPVVGQPYPPPGYPSRDEYNDFFMARNDSPWINQNRPRNIRTKTCIVSYPTQNLVYWKLVDSDTLESIKSSALELFDE